MNNIMLDIETMAACPNAAIVSVAAVPFDLKTNQTGKPFHEIVDIQSCIDLGLSVSGSAIAFWARQKDEIRKQLTDKGKNITHVLFEFRKYMQDLNGKSIKIWAMSPQFDMVILGNAYNKLRQDNPWHYRNERDVRTISSFDPSIRERMEKENNKEGLHDPLMDCFFQIDLLRAFYKRFEEDGLLWPEMEEPTQANPPISA